MTPKRFASSVLTGCAAATFFLTAGAEQLVRMTPARLYFVKRLPDLTDYLVLALLIGLIGLIAGWFELRGYRLPVFVLCSFGVTHLVQGHLSRYAPLWNSVGREWKQFGVVVADGWFYIGLTCGAAVMVLLARFRPLWDGFLPILRGGATIIWGLIGLKIVSPPRFFPAQASVQQRAPLKQVDYAHARPPIVWIVFDEWDYDLTFRRPAENAVAFPEIERLRRESVFFEQVKAAGRVTLVAIPNLLAGAQSADYHAVNASTGRLSAESFPSGVETVFDAAVRAGYRSSVVGWYHPYCRLFGAQLESCYWDDAAMPVLEPGASVGRRARAMLREALDLEWAPGIGFSNAIERHIERYGPMLRESQRVAARKGAVFSFLHLAVPHPPFFDRQGRRIASSVDAYVNGIQRADEALGAIRREMTRAGVWDDALVVVTSDHPYRYQYLGGYGNGHVPLLVKFPHQTSGAVHKPQFEARAIRGILDATMGGSMPNVDAGLAWLESASASDAQASSR